MLKRQLPKLFARLVFSVLVVLAFAPESLWRLSLLTLLIVGLVVDVLLAILAQTRRPPLTVPVWLRDHFSGSLALSAAALVFVTRVPPGLKKYAGLVIFGAGTYKLLIDCILVVQTSRLLYTLHSSFSQNTPAPARYVYGAVFQIGGSARKYLRRVFFRVEWALWRFHRKIDLSQATRADIQEYKLLMQREVDHLRKRDSRGLRLLVSMAIRVPALVGQTSRFVLGDMLRGREMTAFFCPSDLASSEGAFTEYAVANANTCIAFITPALWEYFREPKVGDIERAEQVISQMPQWIRRASVRGRKEMERQMITTTRALHFCLGPSFLFVPEAQNVESDFQPQHGYETVLMFGGASARPCASEITRVLAGTCVPLRQLDSALGPELARLIHKLAESGLAPLADAYLRFRLSSSDVERFFCLLDCFEVLIKYSVFVLGGGEPEFATKRRSIATLGTWKTWLVQYLNSNNSTTSGSSAGSDVSSHDRRSFEGELCAAWRRGVTEHVCDLTSALQRASIIDEVQIGSATWSSWLSWLVEFRNVTKGHGGVDEKAVKPWLHLFHAVLIDLISALCVLTLDTYLVGICHDGTEVQLRGWLRGKRRSSTLLSKTPLRSVTVNEELRAEGFATAYPVHGSVVVSRNSVLTWHSRTKEQVDTYVDYLTGSVRSLSG